MCEGKFFAHCVGECGGGSGDSLGGRAGACSWGVLKVHVEAREILGQQCWSCRKQASDATVIAGWRAFGGTPPLRRPIVEFGEGWKSLGRGLWRGRALSSKVSVGHIALSAQLRLRENQGRTARRDCALLPHLRCLLASWLPDFLARRMSVVDQKVL